MRIILLKGFSMVKIVEDVFSQGFVEVHENDTVSSCISLFKKETPPVLAARVSILGVLC